MAGTPHRRGIVRLAIAAALLAALVATAAVEAGSLVRRTCWACPTRSSATAGANS